MVDKILFSSGDDADSENKTSWETPAAMFKALDDEFHFQLDPAATVENRKCSIYFTKEVDGLTQPWAPLRTFVNPPYGRRMSGLWVAKAAEECQAGSLVVMLIPARTDTAWFHDYIWNEEKNACHPGVEVRFVRRRIKYEFGGKPSKNSATFPSVIVIFRPAEPCPICGRKEMTEHNLDQEGEWCSCHC